MHSAVIGHQENALRRDLDQSIERIIGLGDDQATPGELHNAAQGVTPPEGRRASRNEAWGLTICPSILGRVNPLSGWRRKSCLCQVYCR